MVTLIFYFDTPDYIKHTLEDLCDKTNVDLLSDIVICNDTGEVIDDISINQLISKKIKFIDSSHIGRAKAWNIAAEESKGGELVFVGGATKFKESWLENILDELSDSDIVSPITHVLDANIWQSMGNRWEKFGWRWDFELCNRHHGKDNITPTASSYCMSVTKKRFTEIGGFDNGMDKGSGEDIEISLRNWLFGGKCKIVTDSIISTASVRKSAYESLKNINRILQAWLPEYESYVRGYHGDLPDAGKISNLLELQHKRIKNNDDILKLILPELFGIFNIRQVANGKSIAVVAPGASLDYINKSMIYRNNIIIGIDYVGMFIDCDYVVTDSVSVIAELKKKYKNSSFILPMVVKNRIIGTHEAAEDICPGSHLFEQKEYGQLQIDSNPPFIDVDNISITTVNMALFMNPSEINLYGFDNRLLNGKSHTSEGKYYDNGEVWPDTESTANKFKFYEYAMQQIGNYAISKNIPITRINHL